MRLHYAIGATVAIALVSASVSTAEDLKSGPQVGEGVGIFEPLNVTGKYEGKKQCLV
jgi:hypothetical protein